MSGSGTGLEVPQTDIESGLESEEVRRRLAKYGYNEIPEKKTSLLVSLGKRFWGIVPWMLEVTAFLTWLLGKYPDTVIIIGLLVFNAAISMLQERRAKLAMAALKQRLRIQSRVKRDGRWSIVQERELVPGDRALKNSLASMPRVIQSEVHQYNSHRKLYSIILLYCCIILKY